MNPIGLYVHIPFCIKKCPYCDFYSVKAEESLMDSYITSLCRTIGQWGKTLGRTADTVYFGGGTPSVLGTKRIETLLDSIRSAFGTAAHEVTVEINPGTVNPPFIRDCRSMGINRLSIGMQSAHKQELSALGRIHCHEDTVNTVSWAHKAKFDNISLDLMLGIPHQTMQSLGQSIKACTRLGASHVSAYLLKIEQNTPFAIHPPPPVDEDMECDLYNLAVEDLDCRGYEQYEISNFAIPGFESRHNLKYWNCEEYLGIGPSAHSLIDSRRFYYPRDLDLFMARASIIDDGKGQTPEEYSMLRLRLNAGLIFDDYEKRFGLPFPDKIKHRADILLGSRMLTMDEHAIRLTKEGFLVSNRIIAHLLADS